MKYYLADAFTDSLFSGNPAGVCVCEQWPSDGMMQRIAGENNLPETAFLCREEGGWRIRWFTPSFEMDLCGHATLAAGFVLMNYVEPGDQAVFESCSGQVRVLRAENDRYVLDFPSRPPVEVPIPAGIEACLGAKVLGCWQSRDMIVLLESAAEVRRISPDFDKMKEIIPQWGMVPTAPGEDCDFVSRYFDPRDTNIEDPVTGSAHCTLTPFWSGRLGKKTLCARQLSPRGGTLLCVDEGRRVKIGGGVVLYLEGELKL